MLSYVRLRLRARREASSLSSPIFIRKTALPARHKSPNCKRSDAVTAGAASFNYSSPQLPPRTTSAAFQVRGPPTAERISGEGSTVVHLKTSPKKRRGGPAGHHGEGRELPRWFSAAGVATAAREATFGRSNRMEASRRGGKGGGSPRQISVAVPRPLRRRRAAAADLRLQAVAGLSSGGGGGLQPVELDVRSRACSDSDHRNI